MTKLASASRSPATARAEPVTSTPVTATTPASASPVPAQVRRLTRCPPARWISAVHTGVVDTSAVEVATVVSRTLGTQVAKCPASTRPDTAVRPSSRRPGRPRASATGTSTTSAIAFRQNATASAGAASAAISGPDVDTPMIAIVRAA